MNWSFRSIHQVTVFLNCNDDELVILNVFDNMGRIVLTKELDVSRGKSLMKIDLQHVAAGNYAVVLNTSDNSYRKLIVIE